MLSVSAIFVALNYLQLLNPLLAPPTQQLILLFLFSIFTFQYLLQLLITSPAQSPSDCGKSCPLVQNLTNSVLSGKTVTSLKKLNHDISLELANQSMQLCRQRDITNSILCSAQTIIIMLKQDGSIHSINSYGENLTGYSMLQLQGKKFTDLYPEDTPNANYDLLQLVPVALGEQQLYQHETQLQRNNGDRYSINWIHSKLQNTLNEDSLILSVGSNITEHKNLGKNMDWLVSYDPLTSLYNRRRFQIELDTAIEACQGKNQPGALLIIDLDNFNDINDSYGHKVGDSVLRKVANNLKSLSLDYQNPANICCARMGGDEFAIIMRDTRHSDACWLARKIIQLLTGITHAHDQSSFQLSSSIGIATFSSSEPRTPNDLLSNANYACNQARKNGPNQMHTYKDDHQHQQKTQHRMFWRDRIEHALKNNRFVLHYQPILNIKLNTISHYETLIRMLDENNEVIAPGLFISIAEKSGLIRQIDDYLISTAIAKQGELRRNGHDVSLSINLSSKAFNDPELFNKIEMAIRLGKANPENLIFEITETGEVTNIATASQLMLRIQSLGCQFSLDDFGVGYSSFDHLRKLPFEYVKIDGSFVTDLANNSDNKALVIALSEVAIGFNKLTVAEFVDSMQTLNMLKLAKVNYAQGYLIGKPSETIPVKLPGFFKVDEFIKPSLH